MFNINLTMNGIEKFEEKLEEVKEKLRRNMNKNIKDVIKKQETPLNGMIYLGQLSPCHLQIAWKNYSEQQLKTELDRINPMYGLCSPCRFQLLTGCTSGQEWSRIQQELHESVEETFSIELPLRYELPEVTNVERY